MTMPYIKQEQCDVLEPFLEDALIAIETDGELNYFITSLVNRFYEPHHYSDYQHIAGLFACLDKEFHRRVIAAYEDQKCEENGDVFNV
jgi:hypothetical protein